MLFWIVRPRDGLKKKSIVLIPLPSLIYFFFSFVLLTGRTAGWGWGWGVRAGRLAQSVVTNSMF